MDIPHFEWDPEKEIQNIAKHGVSFREAQEAFADDRRVIAEDMEHSDGEPRCFCFGRVERGILTVRYTMRDGFIRIIGAGFWRKGRVIYERQSSLYR